jgi:hypothetical protein
MRSMADVVLVDLGFLVGAGLVRSDERKVKSDEWQLGGRHASYL